VVTEAPQASLAYPGEAAAPAGGPLRAIWESSSPLLGRKHLATRRRSLAEDARGVVVNGRFDLLLEGIEEALAAGTDPHGPSTEPSQP
jgi:hypothetical protein